MTHSPGKNSSIPDKSNIPTSFNNDPHEKMISKTSLGITQHNLQVIMLLPLNLQVSPNPCTEVTVKE
jgi:hypothetical protein